MLKKILKYGFSLIFIISFGMMLTTVNVFAEGTGTVAVWDRTDIVLTSSKTYDNPYLDVNVEAIFTHTDGTEIKLSGFWNGDNEWRVRFAPTKAGTWNYVITSNKTDDIATEGFTGLHNVTGSVSAYQVTADETSNPNLLHGFINFSENGRYFQYADGTSFYWLGDTNWQAPNYVSITQCNYPGCDCGNQFEHEVNDRLEKGFTVYQTYFDSAESDGGGQRSTTTEPSLWVWAAENQTKASSSNGTGYAACYSRDGKENTYWCATGPTSAENPEWVAYDLGVKEKFNRIDMLVYYANMSHTFEVYGSNDASAWETAGAINGWTKIHEQTVASDSEKRITLTFDNEAEYQYIKICFKACSGWPALYELEVALDEYESTVESKASSSNGTSYAVSHTYDGKENTYWCATGPTSVENPEWIAYDLGTKEKFNRIDMLAYYANMSYTFEIYGSDEASAWETAGATTGWTKVHEQTVTSDSEKRITLTFDNEAEYQYIKVCFKNCPGWPALYELEVALDEYESTVESKVSSNNSTRSDAPSFTYDGKENTYWCATGPTSTENPEWIAYNLGTKEKFNRIDMLAYYANMSYTFEIYGSDDASAWETAGATTGWTKVHEQTVTSDSEKTLTLTFDNEAEYQYIKICFKSCPGWPALYELEVAFGDMGEDLLTSANRKVLTEEGENLLTSTGRKVLTKTGENLIDTTSKYNAINPQTFTDKIDKMFDYLADNGMVIALGYGVHSNTVSRMSEEELAVLSRYLTARYGSYPVVWITGQEINGEDSLDRWIDSAEVVDEWDGYNHPQGGHMLVRVATDATVVKLGNQEWHEWWAVQGGHGTIAKKAYYEGYWNTGKIFLETEACYEEVMCGGYNDYEKSRISAWKANLCGSYGFTYGATGIWGNCYSTAGNTGWLGTFSNEPWYMGLDKAGSFEMTYLKNFFEYAEFNTLIPRFDNTAYSNLTAEDKLVSSNDDGSTYVGYFYNSDLSTGEFYGLNTDKNYTARWYNPLTGKFIDIENMEITAEGKYIIPEKPTTGDWAILVTSKELGAYETEEAYEVVEVDEDIFEQNNLALCVDAKASTGNVDANTGVSYEADKSNDGDESSYWCATSGTYPQWVAYDLGSKQAFDHVDVQMKASISGVQLTLYGSNDVSAWNTAGEATGWNPIYELPLTGGLDFSMVIDEVEYQYVKIEFTGDSKDWATFTEVKIYKYEEPQEEYEELPEFSGTVQTPTVKCTSGAIYSADGVLTDTKANLIDKDYDTCWAPFSPFASQIIILDLQKEMDLNGIVVTLGEDAYLPQYRVEASNNGTDWTILADATLRSRQSTVVSGNRKMYEELSGQYRYVKLFWMGGMNNTTIKTIAEIEVYAYETTDQ